MWKVIGNIYRLLESVCREQRDGFIKCPACKLSGSSPNVHNQNNGKHHSLVGQPCRFCEGHGVLPLTGLKGFVLVETANGFQTQDLTPVLKTKVLSRTTSSCSSCSQKINHSTSIELKTCLSTNRYLVTTLKSPPWLADVHQWSMRTSPCSLGRDDTMPQILHPKFPKNFFKSIMICRPLFSDGLLIPLVASVLSSHSADAHVITSGRTLAHEATGNGDNGSHQSEAIFQIRTQPSVSKKLHRHARKRRNSLREKATEAAEARARWILMSLVSRGSKS